MRKLCSCQRAGHDTLLLIVLVLSVTSCIVHVHCDCILGVLNPASSWTVTNRHIVNSILPDIIKPEDTTTQSKVPFRPSEAKLYAEVRPAVPPARQSRICLRSMSSVSAACSAGRVVSAADPAPTDPGSFIFNVTEGVPQGPCLLLNDAGTEAQLKQERPRPADCWPGAGYCFDSSTVWSLKTNSTAGEQLVWLTIVRTISMYQDTDSRIDIMTTTIPFKVTQGCVLKVPVGGAAAASSSCLDCTNKRVSVQPIQRSSSCLRCPMRSSKPRDAAALAAGSSNWRCIPGMPKGFESITVRMGAGGNPECASVNGKTCLRNIGTAKTCQAMAALLNKSPSPSTNRPSPGVISERITAEAGVPVLKPLTCGAAHAAVWPKVTGYTTPGHWCITSRDWLQDTQPLVQGRCVMQA